MKDESQNKTLNGLTSSAKKPGNSLWSDAVRRLKKDKIAMVSFVVILFYTLTALGALLGWIAPDYTKTNYDDAYENPSLEHIFGTDIFGRDVLARVIHGTKIAMGIGLITSVIAIFIGTSLGSIAGYYGGKLDDAIVWLYSIISSIPSLLLILALSFVLGKGIFAVFMSIGLTTWVGVCRLVRGEFMKHKERDYIQAAKALGARDSSLIFKHILPNVFHILIINFTLQFVFAIKSEVIISYLGVGVQSEPSWGVMISDAKLELTRGVWWQLSAATIAMFIIVLAFQLFGDALRDALDPKLKK